MSKRNSFESENVSDDDEEEKDTKKTNSSNKEDSPQSILPNYDLIKAISTTLNSILDQEAQKNIAYQIYENLSIEILENALRMGVFIKQGDMILQKKLEYYENLMKVFISMLKCDKITCLLFQKEILEVFKNIFNCNWLHQGEMIEFILSKEKNIKNNQTPVKMILNDLRKDYFVTRRKNYYKIN